MKNLDATAYPRNGQSKEMDVIRSKHMRDLREKPLPLDAEGEQHIRAMMHAWAACSGSDALDEGLIDFLRWSIRRESLFHRTKHEAALDRQRVDLSADRVCLARLHFKRQDKVVLQLARGTNRLNLGIIQIGSEALPVYFESEEMAVAFARPRCRKCKQSSEDSQMVWFEADLCSKCANGVGR